MRRLIPVCAIVAGLTVAASAQDTTVKSRTTVKADDDATVVSLTGCLRQDSLNGRYTLLGAMAAAGERVRTDTRVETDIDDDDVDVKATTKSRADGPVATAGAISTYVLVPQRGVTLLPHVGNRIQVTAVMLKPGEDDADVKIEDRTRVDPDDGPATTARGKTKIEVERAGDGQYAVVSVKSLGGTCAAR